MKNWITIREWEEASGRPAPKVSYLPKVIRQGEFHPVTVARPDLTKPNITWQEMAILCGLKVIDGKVHS